MMRPALAKVNQNIPVLIMTTATILFGNLRLGPGKGERLHCGRQDIKRAAAQVWTEVWTSTKRPPVMAASKSF
jgi:hypothetical protein